MYAAKSIAFSSIAPGAEYAGSEKSFPAACSQTCRRRRWNRTRLKIEQHLSPNTTLSVGYIGSHGYHELLSVGRECACSDDLPGIPCPAGYPAWTWSTHPRRGTGQHCGVRIRRTGSRKEISSYNGLEVDVNHHFSHGLAIPRRLHLCEGARRWRQHEYQRGHEFSRVCRQSAGAEMRIMAAARLTFATPRLSMPPMTFRLDAARHSGGWVDRLVGRLASSARIETLQSGLPFTPQIVLQPCERRRQRAIRCGRRGIPTSRVR